jgi:hypothetical protein
MPETMVTARMVICDARRGPLVEMTAGITSV